MTAPPESGIDWVAAYNDLRWLLTLARAATTLGLTPSLTALLVDLYAEHHRRATPKS